MQMQAQVSILAPCNDNITTVFQFWFIYFLACAQHKVMSFIAAVDLHTGLKRRPPTLEWHPKKHPLLLNVDDFLIFRARISFVGFMAVSRQFFSSPTLNPGSLQAIAAMVTTSFIDFKQTFNSIRLGPCYGP